MNTDFNPTPGYWRFPDEQLMLSVDDVDLVHREPTSLGTSGGAYTTRTVRSDT